MEPNQFLGLLKFFNNEQYLDLLMSGLVHCQPPEVYRIHDQEGVGDRFESCIHSWRSSRNDPALQININGVEISPSDLKAFTVQQDGGDSWLSCWFCLRLPEDDDALELLKEDLVRMKREFGGMYLFLPAYNTRAFLERIKAASEKPVWAQEVAYCDESVSWSSRCKSTAFRYQREYRFGFGQCSVNELEPYVFECSGGFSDLFYRCPEFQLCHQETNEVFLDLGGL